MKSPNFAFLSAHDELLVRTGAQAERLFAVDPLASLVKLRRFGELLALETAASVGLDASSEVRQIDLLGSLWDRGLLTPEVSQLFHGLRKAGNLAAHHDRGGASDALHQLKMARKLAIWFHRTFGDPAFKPSPFVPPPDPAGAETALREELAAAREELALAQSHAKKAKLTAAEEARLREAAEAEAKAAYADMEAALELSHETEAAVVEQQRLFDAGLAQRQAEAAKATPEAISATVEAAQTAAAELDLSEAETRRMIDLQLVEAGWEADSAKLRHSRGTRPIKGRNLAIAEWPTSSGPADYVLFAGLIPVAIVEAKRKRKDVRGSLVQSKRYSRDFVLEAEGMTAPKGGPWGEYRVPFLFATNGRPYLRQLLMASGIWFLDARRPTNQPRALEGWYSPEGLSKLLAHDIAAADERLAEEPADYLPLRDYQREAIAAVEAGIAAGKRAMLLAMATGTGKTRTCICLLYRLLKAGRFRRALFLVDRTSLGDQAHDSFKTLKLEQQQSFTEIYEAKGLSDLRPEGDTRLHVATIQGMVRRLLDEHADPIPVDEYDCIVVDECHRGYNLDLDLSDRELLFRSEADYISKYRRVLDHFDAVKIGLTATPALHTKKIFGAPVFTYSYRQAVIDDFLVDHEPPYQIATKLGTDGITWRAGEEVEVYRVRPQQLDLINTPDEVTVEIEGFNKRVITESFNRVVCQYLAEHIDPSLPGKTLIFCATDRHADMVVDLLTKAFAEKYGECEHEAVVKITGNSDKPASLIRHLKNERNPRVAVTVDLLTTGIDVPEITNLVFIRRVRSRILYEQMLGRATRLCKEIGKRYFRVFDAVDLYSALEPYSSMKPVVTDPSITFAKLVQELAEHGDDPELAELISEQLRAKFQRKRRGLSERGRKAFAAKAGIDADDLREAMRSWDTGELLEWWTEHGALVTWLDREPSGDGPVILISHHEDELVSESRGYGAASKPEDYLESFAAFLRDNLNLIPALKIVTQRPRELTRAQLRELKLALDAAGFTEARLESAWRDTTNQEVVATIIGHIRRQALGSPLVPYQERVARAMERLLASRTWSAPQRRWLDKIGNQLATEMIIDREALDQGAFRRDGGFRRLNKVFDGQLEQVLGTLREELWSDAG